MEKQSKEESVRGLAMLQSQGGESQSARLSEPPAPLAVLVDLRAVKQTIAPPQEQDHRHGQRNTGQHGLLLGIFSLAFLKTLL